MKKAIFFGLPGIALAAFSFIDSPQTLAGRWQQNFRSGASALVVFRSDNSYDGFVNGKAFVSGKYYVNLDTVRFSDAICNPNYQGTYKLSFFTKDSVRFTVIQDTCRQRRMGTDGFTLGRIPQTKPRK